LPSKRTLSRGDVQAFANNTVGVAAAGLDDVTFLLMKNNYYS
jgi:hypothetical protein